MLEKIIMLCTSEGLLQKITVPKLNIEQFKIGPIGWMLVDNIMKEWFNNIVINKDVTVFPSGDDTSESFNFVKELCLQNLPFGIAEVVTLKNLKSSDEIIEYYNFKKNEVQVDFNTFLRNEDQKILKCTVFVSPNNAMQFFHQWQKQRRIWWRKFSASPGRYSLTDIKHGENNTQNVNIIVKYPWALQEIESLTLSTPEKNYNNLQLQCKDGRKTVTACSVTSKILLSTIFLNTISDAFEEPLFHDKPRTMLKFHRKLAPYKISFSISSSSSTSTSELSSLALYLCRLLRTNNVSCLLLPSSIKNTLEAQYKQYDKLGIPYNVVLNENTLKDGIINLRSRDTTLKEQVHVSELVNYVEQLLKNY